MLTLGSRRRRAPSVPSTSGTAEREALASDQALSASVEVRQETVEVAQEETSVEKRARTEVPVEQGPDAGRASQSPERIPWRPSLLLEPGRAMSVDDCVQGNPKVIAALSQACALPRDMVKHREADDLTLLVSSMQSTLALLQKEQVLLERFQDNNARIARMLGEKKELIAALGASNQIARVQEERIKGLVAELEVSKAETEAKKQRSAELEKQRQEAEAKLQSEIDKAYSEGVAFASSSYDAQVLEVRDDVWELGWLAALKEAGVSEDHPAYKNPAKFPEPESSPAPSPSAEVAAEVAATEDIPPSSANDDVPAAV